MNLLDFAKDYTKNYPPKERAAILDFVDKWEDFLIELKEQYKKDKGSLHPDDIKQAERHLVFDRTIDAIRAIHALMDLKKSSFPSGGVEFTSDDSMIDLGDGEKIFDMPKEKTKGFQEKLKEGAPLKVKKESSFSFAKDDNGHLIFNGTTY